MNLGYPLQLRRRTIRRLCGCSLCSPWHWCVRRKTDRRFLGGSTNDAPKFEYGAHTTGVSTVANYLPQLPVPPQLITTKPGGVRFVKFANAIISARHNGAHTMA